MKRVVVIGTSCSGKTTYAHQLARFLNVPHIELDVIHWQSNWRPRPVESFRVLVQSIVEQDCWVIDGNYSVVQDIVWGNATHIIWLNYPFRIVIWRALRRTVIRVFKKIELFSGNRETFKHAFLSKDSILWWVLTTFQSHRRRYQTLFTGSKFPHLTYIELHNSHEAEALINQIIYLIDRIRRKS
jgi:adenylate kinase family enzyme